MTRMLNVLYFGCASASITNQPLPQPCYSVFSVSCYIILCPVHHHVYDFNPVLCGALQILRCKIFLDKDQVKLQSHTMKTLQQSKNALVYFIE